MGPGPFLAALGIVIFGVAVSAIVQLDNNVVVQHQKYIDDCHTKQGIVVHDGPHADNCYDPLTTKRIFLDAEIVK